MSVLVIVHRPSPAGGREREILLLERALHPGYWQSVTGSLEPAETPMMAALREVQEETGIVAATADLQDWRQQNEYGIFPEWRDRYAPGITRNLEHVFSLAVSRTQPVRLRFAEHRAFCWLALIAAAAHCFSPSNRDAILSLPTRWK